MPSATDQRWVLFAVRPAAALAFSSSVEAGRDSTPVRGGREVRAGDRRPPQPVGALVRPRRQGSRAVRRGRPVLVGQVETSVGLSTGAVLTARFLAARVSPATCSLFTQPEMTDAVEGALRAYLTDVEVGFDADCWSSSVPTWDAVGRTRPFFRTTRRSAGIPSSLDAVAEIARRVWGVTVRAGVVGSCSRPIIATPPWRFRRCVRRLAEMVVSCHRARVGLVVDVSYPSFSCFSSCLIVDALP